MSPLAAFIFLIVFSLLGPQAGLAQSGFPFQDESLAYSVNWPGGASLGEGRFAAKREKLPDSSQQRWIFEFTLDASVPGIAITDRYRSVATSNLCSVEFEKESTHGPKKSREKVVFAQDRGTARRTTTSGGSSDLSVSPCAKDALAFLYFTRREMGQGRVATDPSIVFGALYQIRLEYTGEQALGKTTIVDRLLASLRGPASTQSFEILFARDAARTPLVIRAPFSLGTFSLELARQQ
jgi:hypothetical protein